MIMNTASRVILFLVVSYCTCNLPTTVSTSRSTSTSSTLMDIRIHRTNSLNSQQQPTTTRAFQSLPASLVLHLRGGNQDVPNPSDFSTSISTDISSSSYSDNNVVGGDDGTYFDPTTPMILDPSESSTLSTDPQPQDDTTSTTTSTETSVESIMESPPPSSSSSSITNANTNTKSKTTFSLSSIIPKLNPKLLNAMERTGPAILLLISGYALLKLFGENALLALIPLMQIGMYYEITDIIQTFHNDGSTTKFDLEQFLEKWWWFFTIFFSTSGKLLLPYFLKGATIHNNNAAFMDLIGFGMIAGGLVMAVIGMETHDLAGPDSFRKYLGKCAAFHFALIFLIGQSSFWIKTIQSFGMEWVLYPAFLVIINDTMAYVFGMLFGKHKLIPRLSPKKTVEGFIGAAFSTGILSIPLLKFMVQSSSSSKFTSIMGTTTKPTQYLIQHAIFMSMYTSFISPFGGFLASAVKRAHGAKDFGKLIPGHGGVVDRFDCQLVTAPFVYLYLNYRASTVTGSGV